MRKKIKKLSPDMFREKSFSFLLEYIAGFQTCNFIKRRLKHMCFLVNIAKFLRTPSYFEQLRKTAFTCFLKEKSVVFVNLGFNI